MPTELTVLVEAEARLDRELGDARAEGIQLEQAARDRIARADAALADEIARREEEVAATIERRAAEQRAALDTDASERIARYTRADIDALAGRVLEDLLAMVTERAS